MYVSHYWAWLICPQRSRSQDDGQLCTLSLWHTLVRIEQQHSKYNAKGSANESETRIDSLERFERLTHAVLFRKQRPRNATNSNSFCLVLRFFFFVFVFGSFECMLLCSSQSSQISFVIGSFPEEHNNPCACEARRVRVYLFSFSLHFPVFSYLERCLCRIKPKTNPRDTFPIPKTPALSRGRWKWRTACNLCQIW